MLFKVKVTPTGVVDRIALELNERILVPAIMHLGARVGVDTLEVHVTSLYVDVMKLHITSILVENMHESYMLDMHIWWQVVQASYTKVGKRELLPGRSKG